MIETSYKQEQVEPPELNEMKRVEARILSRLDRRSSLIVLGDRYDVEHIGTDKSRSSVSTPTVNIKRSSRMRSAPNVVKSELALSTKTGAHV